MHGQSNTTFGRQHLFDGELKKVSTAKGLNGKYYETVISTYSKSRNENGRAFSVYIER